MDAETIRGIVKETVSELRRVGMLKDPDTEIYKEVSDKLRSYYKTGIPKMIKFALAKIESDPYYGILNLYYKNGLSNEKIAEILNVDVSTVTRNKKRLCLEIHKML